MEYNYKNDFPFFENNKNFIYFDTAATAQRPKQVLDAISDFYINKNANPLRGLYSISEKATQAYEDSRKTVASFINAKSSEEIIFTRNTTESLNLVAYSYGYNNLKKDDEICVSIMEHHSNIVPWQQICKITGAKLVFLYCNKTTGEISDQELNLKITNKTKIVSITHVSNVLGITNPIKKIASLAHKNNAICIVDGAQATPHFKVDVQDLDVDFYALSGHKFCGPMGIGALYGKKQLLENLSPFLTGGEMIEYVTEQSATWAELPHKFEAGTVSAADAVGMATAINYINSIGLEKITEHDNNLSKTLIDGLLKIPHVNIIGSPDAYKHCGIVTFTIDGVHPHDIATLLNEENIAIRAGHHCAQPLQHYLNIDASARASLYLYNTYDEVQIFIDKVSQIRKWSGYKD